jgi:hypothetical protein
MTITDVFEWLQTACPLDFTTENVFLAVPDHPIPVDHDGRYRVTLCDHTRSADDTTTLINNAAPGGLVLFNKSPGEVLQGHNATLDDIFFDYFEYDDGIFVGRKHAPTAHYLPVYPHTRVAVQRPSRNLIYVLCPTSEAVQKSYETYKNASWARAVIIPTTFYLESVAYYHVLASRAAEWHYADYVGCIGWSASTKVTSTNFNEIIDQSNNADVVAFMYRGDALVKTADEWHPQFSKIWCPVLESMGYSHDDVVSEKIPSFYCNYWVARPSHMTQYLSFFQKFKIALETTPSIQSALWSDSQYKDRGTDIAKLTDEQCMTIWGVPYYPYHPFICERLPCFFFWSIQAKLAGVR